ncbi:MAG TPA: preprotein translocase subunit SecG [Chitinophagaceae bacterium]
MVILFVILIVLSCVILGFFVLVQNPKGGGLSGSIAGFSNQFMGVKQTTDVLEKGTWVFAAIVGILCLCSTVFMKTGSSHSIVNDIDTKQRQPTQQAQPANPQPQPANTAPHKP